VRTLTGYRRGRWFRHVREQPARTRRSAPRGAAGYWPDIDEELGLAGMLGVSEDALEEAAGFTIHIRESLPD
jgi:hypothetical protein